MCHLSMAWLESYLEGIYEMLENDIPNIRNDEIPEGPYTLRSVSNQMKVSNLTTHVLGFDGLEI